MLRTDICDHKSVKTLWGSSLYDMKKYSGILYCFYKSTGNYLPPLGKQELFSVKLQLFNNKMEESCLLQTHFSSFDFGTTCNSQFSSISEIPVETLFIYSSDLGYTYDNFISFCNTVSNRPIICKNHIKTFENRYYNRQRAVFCKVPDILSSHKDTTNRKVDRRLTDLQVNQVFAATGVVLPIGTGICRQCRLGLFKDTPNDISNRKSDKVSTNADHDVFQDDAIPAKRRRKKVIPYTLCCENLACESLGCEDIGCEDLGCEEFSQSSIPETENSQNTTASQLSEASVSCTAKLDALNNYLALCGVSPVKECQVAIGRSSARTQNRYIEKTKQCLEHIFSTICPGEEEFLKKAVMDHTSHTSRSEDQAVLETLVEIYYRADIPSQWPLQRQILSTLVKDKDFPEARTIIPSLTRWKYSHAKQHIESYGVGAPVPNQKVIREKYSPCQVDHFIDFITSGQIMKDQPFGEKTLKMETGEVIKIPTVIRSLIPSSIISQYMDLCKEDNIKPLGESTLFKILEECSAVVRKCIEGLDNFVMEGCKGFDELHKILSEMASEKSKSLKADLQKGKSYLKTGFKSHVSRESNVEDHCISYALSSVESCFKSACSHDHSLMCTECNILENCLEEVLKTTKEHQWNNKEATMYIVEDAIQAIRRWKSHIVRSRNQEQAKTDLLKDMTEEEALITCDWAMKFLPRKYREGQVDWFAKRGLNWHIAVALIKTGLQFTTLTYVHIFENPISQDASVTSKILIDVATDLLKTRPNLKLNFMSDNAGCYKSAVNLLMLYYKLGERMTAYHFCEAQNGKGPCDRRAAHIKSMIRRYINQGNDVTSAAQMKEAVQKEGKCKSDIKIKVVNAVNVIDGKKGKTNIPLISKLYNFVYEVRGLRMWKAYNIGEGKLIHWDSLPCPQEVVELQTVIDWNQGESRIVEIDTGAVADESTTKSLMCPIENCTRQFATQKAVDDHILLGNCTFDGKERMSVAERAKYVYAHKIISLYPSPSDYQEAQDIPIVDSNCCNHLQMGWALKEVKPRATFTTKQKDFIVAKFNIGKKTGNKVDPFSAAEEMRLSGNFKRDEFLSGQQISSYFSRLAAQDRKTSDLDYAAALEEDKKQTLKLKIENCIADNQL